MKWFTVARFVRILTLKATLFGATAAFSLLGPLAHSQQDVNPTWWDPWAPANKVVVKPSQPRTSNRKPTQRTVTAASHRKRPKLRAKRSIGGGS
jgi:hypothetical protein